MSPRTGLTCPAACDLSHGWLAVGKHDSAPFAGIALLLGLKLTLMGDAGASSFRFSA